MIKFAHRPSWQHPPAHRWAALLLATLPFGILLALWGLNGCSSPDGPVDCPRSLHSSPPSNTPSWHPDGHLITFNHVPIASVEDFGYCGAIQRFDIDASGIYGILDGDPPKRLLPMTLGDPSWSPAGDRLAFQSFGNIFTIALDGDSLDTSTVQQLTFDGISYQPAWSPDGSTIAYYLAGCGNADTTSCGVAIMTPSGEEKTQIIRGVYPSWYPDSRRILYMGLGEEFFKYDIVDSLATRVTRFKTPTKNNYQPAVAPDGGSIAFASQRDGPLNIWIVDTDGTNLRRLTSGGTTDRFCWSPDSQYILYINYDADDFSEDNGSLWMINVQSSEKHRLVHGSLK